MPMLDLALRTYLLSHTCRRVVRTAWLLLGLSWAALTWAQLPNAIAPSAIVNTPQVRAELVVHAPQGVQAGQPLWVGLQLTHQAEWHTYWRNPGDSGLPTQLEWQLPKGIQAGEIQWPLPHKLKAGSLTNYGFEHTVLLAVPLTVDRSFNAQTSPALEIQLHANWLVCRLECIPQEGDFVLRLPTQSSSATHAAAFEALRAQQPQALTHAQAKASFEGQQLVIQINGLPSTWQGQRLAVFPHGVELLESATDQHPQATQSWQNDSWTARLPVSSLRQTAPPSLELLLVQGSGSARQGVTVRLPVEGTWPSVEDTQPLTTTPTPALDANATAATFVLALVGAFLGGLILNLMPCVLPVLAIKLLGFAQHSRQHRAHRIAGLAYTAGVVLSFLVLGASVLALRAAGEQLGWGFQLQSPVVVSLLAVLFTLIALNLLGSFEFGQILPSRWLSLQAQHPVVDAGLSGVLAVAVASPCTAPFMGASLGLAMTLPTWQALSIFMAMGVGLALPYLVACFVPAVAKRLPQPGPWMVVLRQVLAFPMLATVVWLLWVLGQQTSLDATIYALSGLLTLTALVWALRLQRRSASVLRVLFALLFAVIGWTFAQELTQTSDTSTAVHAPNAPTTATAHGWQAWSESKVAQELAQNRPVFVDFTAAWCVTCQINKKTTLTNAEIVADFATHQVTLLRADWTRRDPAITAALTALGRSGVPVYVLYAPGRAPQVLSELLSVRQVRDALATLPATTSSPSASEFRLQPKPNVPSPLSLPKS